MALYELVVNRGCYSIFCCIGNRTQVKVRSSVVSAMCFPIDKGFMDGHLGLSMEVMIVGHLDGSVCRVEILDSTTYNIQTVEKASRQNGDYLSHSLFIFGKIKA